MVKRQNRCPRCGRLRRRTGEEFVTLAENAICDTEMSAARELYDPQANARPSVYLTCCDPIRHCRQFDSKDRVEFWPAFAHPRWLPCEQLYRPHRASR